MDDAKITLFYSVVSKHINVDLANFYYSIGHIGDMEGYGLIEIPLKIVKGKAWKNCINESSDFMAKLFQKKKERLDNQTPLSIAFKQFEINPSAKNYTILDSYLLDYQAEYNEKNNN